MKKQNWIRKPLIVGTLGLMLVNTTAPINVLANKEAVEDLHILQLGDQYKELITLKEYLDLLGYTIEQEQEEEQDIFTDALFELIKQYQKDNDLEASGKLDEEFFTLVEVQAITESLDLLGYTIEENTNKENLEKDTDEKEEIFTEELSELIKQYQEDNDLVVTGEIDEEVFDLIELQVNELEENEDSNDADTDVNNENVEEDNTFDENPEQAEETDEVEDATSEEVVEDDATITNKKSTIYKAQASSAPTVLKNGMRHANVKQLKMDLKKLGFQVPGNGTTLYGTQTERKVSEFQRYYGLAADGQAGPATFNKINSILKSPLQRGKRHKDTQRLKANLKSLGFTVPGNGTTLYGTQTEAKVKEFQKKYGLVQNGIADEITLKKINELLNPSVLENGMRHNNVKTLKVNLKKLGFRVPGNGTTLYGKQTEKKVREFQLYYGLSVSGKVDTVTDNKINSILKTSLQRGKRHKDTQTLKANLKTLGFTVPGNGTTLYGKQTEAKVKEFQKKYGLVQNGIADEVTLKKIAELIDAKQNPSVLENGVRHADVKTLKRNLKKLGFTVPGNGTTLYGKQTEAKVKEFQKYFGLSVTGKVDNVTDNKINSILKTPLQRGKRHKDTQTLKRDLATLGYFVPGNGTTLYGKQTEAQVKKFQKNQRLVVNGIADEVTLAKIAALLKIENEKPQEITEYTNYGLSLNQAVDLQLRDSKPHTDKYRDQDAYVSVNYITLSGKGVITGGNVNIRTEPKRGAKVAYKLKRGSTINVVKPVNGGYFEDTNVWYEISDGGKKYYVHSNYSDINEGKAISGVNVRANSNTSSHIYGMLAANEKVSILEKSPYWYKIDYKVWRNPTKADLRNAMDPSKGDKFQHLRLDTLAGATAGQLNKMFRSDGILHNQGQAFINGARKAKINEAYLVSHAILETGNGTSKLARGIEVGINNAGNPTVVTKSNRKSLKEIKTVYNMFGIGAHDRDPNNLGAIEAYKQGWDTPAKAIEGGAEWVGEGYIHNAYSQNTIYKMRWNPQMNNGAVWKQYASDMNWANKQIGRIKEVYKHIDKPNLHFDEPKYN